MRREIKEAKKEEGKEMRIFDVLKKILLFPWTVIVFIFKKLTWAGVFFFMSLAVMFVLVLSSVTINQTIAELMREINLYENIWRGRIIDLAEIIEDIVDITTENDNRQIEIVNQQQEIIVDLVDNLTKLGKTSSENDKKHYVLIEKILEDTNILKNNYSVLAGKLNLMEQIDVDNVEDIKRANIFIVNASQSIHGSGSHIKINNKHYILTCAHLVKEMEDFIWAKLDNNTYQPLGLVKINKEVDLALFEISMFEDLPFLEISQEYPKEGSKILVIGNPANEEDFITNGIITDIKDEGYVFTNLIYFGNSGGAILYKGKLVGVVNEIRTYWNFPLVINYGHGVNLKTVKDFLGLK